VCDVHGGVFVAVPSLQARGAEVLVALTPALFRALPVAVVHGDILVVALLLRDRRVRERLGDAGQAGAALWAGETVQQCGISCGERAWLLLRFCQIGLARVSCGRVGETDSPLWLAGCRYGPF
jgi:hypothetical protein